jgi:hypothetical protein
MMAICAQMEDAIIIMRTAVLVSGETHWCHVHVVVVIQVVREARGRYVIFLIWIEIQFFAFFTSIIL